MEGVIATWEMGCVCIKARTCMGRVHVAKGRACVPKKIQKTLNGRNSLKKCPN